MTDQQTTAARFGFDQAERARLRDLIAELSYSIGEEKRLASGRTSNFYFNMKPTMLNPEGSVLIARAMLKVAAGLDVRFVGGLEMGAVPLVCTLGAVSHLEGTPVQPFFVRKKAKEHGARLRIEGLYDAGVLAGAPVLMLEDVTTTGGSVRDAIDVVRAAGAEVAHVLTVVDRLEGAAESLAADGIALLSLFTADDFRA